MPFYKFLKTPAGLKFKDCAGSKKKKKKKKTQECNTLSTCFLVGVIFDAVFKPGVHA